MARSVAEFVVSKEPWEKDVSTEARTAPLPTWAVPDALSMDW